MTARCGRTTGTRRATTPYARVGRQDLTAHVDFTALIEAGEDVGLMPVTLMTQREFLTNLGAEVFLDAIAASDAPKQADLKGLRSILDPAGLGGFRVLVQVKGGSRRRAGVSGWRGRAAGFGGANRSRSAAAAFECGASEPVGGPPRRLDGVGSVPAGRGDL